MWFITAPLVTSQAEADQIITIVTQLVQDFLQPGLANENAIGIAWRGI